MVDGALGGLMEGLDVEMETEMEMEMGPRCCEGLAIWRFGIEGVVRAVGGGVFGLGWDWARANWCMRIMIPPFSCGLILATYLAPASLAIMQTGL